MTSRHEHDFNVLVTMSAANWPIGSTLRKGNRLAGITRAEDKSIGHKLGRSI